MEGKQLIQTAVLLALVLFGVIYSYIEFFIAPLAHERQALEVKMSTATTEIASGGEQLHKILNEEQTEEKNGAQDRLLERLIQTVPGVPQVVCPTLLSKVMISHGIMGSKIGVSGFLPFPGIQGGILQSWSINCPQVKPVAFGEAIAEIENQLPMAQISEFNIQRNPSNSVLFSECTVQFATFR